MGDSHEYTEKQVWGGQILTRQHSRRFGKTPHILKLSVYTRISFKSALCLMNVTKHLLLLVELAPLVLEPLHVVRGHRVLPGALGKSKHSI